MLQRLTRSLKSEPFLWVSLLLAAVLYCLVSLVNHYCFRTYTLDLGAYTNALYDYAHFSLNDSSAFNEIPENLLADHFDLYLPLFSPLSYLFGTYTLLIVQVFATLGGAIGVYRYFSFTHPESNIKRFALIYFLLFFGVFAAFSFDYHSNVVATMLVPWLLLAFQKRQIVKAGILVLFILIAKENMALWMTFIGLGTSVYYFRDKKLRYFSWGIALFSIVYFMLITGIVMPALSNAGKYPHFHYSVLGENSGDALKQLLSHPIDSFRLLFVNHSGIAANNFVKAELWIVLAVCGFFSLRKPVYLFMLIPVLAQKLYHDNVAMWGINQHYAVEFAPLLAIGSFETIATIRNLRWRKITAFIAVLFSLACTIRVMDNTVAYAEKARIRVYKAAHYNREFPVDEAYDVLKRIPEDAVVSAQSAFVPHLALRESVYQFPVVRDATFILLSPVDNPYPLSQEQFFQKKDSLLNTPVWRVVIDNKSFILLQKKQP